MSRQRFGHLPVLCTQLGDCLLVTPPQLGCGASGPKGFFLPAALWLNVTMVVITAKIGWLRQPCLLAFEWIAMGVKR